MYCTLSQLKNNWCPYMWAFCCDGLSCCYQQRRRWDDAGSLASSSSPSCPQFRCTSGPEAIKSHYDKVQHQNKIMRQIRGIKKWGKNIKGRGDADEKEEILFMLDVVMMPIFRCTIKLGWPHQPPPGQLSRWLIWLLIFFFKYRICYWTYLLAVTFTFIILLFAHT